LQECPFLTKACPSFVALTRRIIKQSSPESRSPQENTQATSELLIARSEMTLYPFALEQPADEIEVRRAGGDQSMIVPHLLDRSAATATAFPFAVIAATPGRRSSRAVDSPNDDGGTVPRRSPPKVFGVRGPKLPAANAATTAIAMQRVPECLEINWLKIRRSYAWPLIGRQSQISDGL
jgi:hypothetical protein